MSTVVVFGDQLNRDIGALADADPDADRILLVESDELLGKGRHVQRNHLVVASMRRFADELTGAGFTVDLRRAASMRAGIEAHVDEHDPDAVVATEPNSRAARALCDRLGIDQVRSNQFLCHHDDFAAWADDRSNPKMEDFYRWTRARLGYLMDGGDPVEGKWNFDADNREPPPDDPSVFPEVPRSSLDDLDQAVLDSLPESHGDAPVGIWATSRRAALARLRRFVDEALPRFGPYEDAMSTTSWSMAHSVLSPYLNLGLLLPGEVCDRVDEAYRAGNVPINSAEGFIRQVIGWREFVWNLYWWWPDHADSNELKHRRHLPPMFTGEATTRMACLADTFDSHRSRAWVHHIPRLMLLSNFANLYGIEPRRLMNWMWSNYVDAAEWVMVPNVMGMALWADGGRMATKPYVSGGAYVNRMSDYCGSCRYDPTKRVGDDACPFTTLYWDFMARHRTTLRSSGRMGRPLANLDWLSDLDEVRKRADAVVRGVRDGTI